MPPPRRKSFNKLKQTLNMYYVDKSKMKSKNSLDANKNFIFT